MQDYYATYQRIDVCLDPYPYGGHTTALDALWMGVPTISLTGQTPVSRSGLSLSSKLGLERFVADSEEALYRHRPADRR